MVQRNVYENNANKFINKEMAFPDNTIIKKNIDATKRLISVFYIGKEVTPQMILNAKNKLPDYHLLNSVINVKQGLKDNSTADLTAMKSQIVQELFVKNQELVQQQKITIEELQNEIKIYSSPELSASILKEVRAFSPEIIEASVTKSLLVTEKNKIDTLYLAYLRFKRLPAWSQHHKLEDWLKARLNTNHVKLVIEK
jgi:hypothetical protein